MNPGDWQAADPDLPMVRAAIKKHGGEIAVHRIYGQGTVSSVQYLPAIRGQWWVCYQ